MSSEDNDSPTRTVASVMAERAKARQHGAASLLRSGPVAEVAEARKADRRSQEGGS